MVSLLSAVVLLVSCGETEPTPTTEPTPDLGVEYSKAELETWRDALAETMFHIPGASGLGLTGGGPEGPERVEIDMYPLRGALENMEAAIANTNVPRRAITINMGCEGEGVWPPEHRREIPDEEPLGDIIHSLELPPQVPYGETVTMKQTLRNAGDETVVVSLGYRPSHDFIVNTTEDDLVWHWLCAKVRLLPIVDHTLEPGGMLEFVGEWEQVDTRGDPVPPGTYIVRGTLSGVDEAYEGDEMFVTDALELKVLNPES